MKYLYNSFMEFEDRDRLVTLKWCDRSIGAPISGTEEVDMVVAEAIAKRREWAIIIFIASGFFWVGRCELL